MHWDQENYSAAGVSEDGLKGLHSTILVELNWTIFIEQSRFLAQIKHIFNMFSSLVDLTGVFYNKEVKGLFSG